MSAPDSALIADNLAVLRGDRTLFEGVSFTVRSGSAVLLRGPNGAGKSSLLLTIAGVLKPSAGRIRVEGADDEGYLQRLHFVGHQTGVKARLSLRENLEFWAALYGAPRETPEKALENVGLGGLGGLEAGYLSAGQTRRLALARLLVAHRPIWLLDEPSSALDAEGDAMLGRLVATHLSKGGILVAATHQPLALPETTAATLLLGGGA